MEDRTAPTEPEAVDPELHWLHHVYRGDGHRQLTVRAVLAGMLLGGVMSLSNLYIVIKTGWSFGVTITAGILAFVLFRALQRVGVIKTEFGMLENNAMQSVASAAGYMTGGGTVAAIPALMMLTESQIPAHRIFFWISAIAFLGVFMAIPMKRQMINQEQLRFPSGVAAAETLRSLHPEESAHVAAASGEEAGAGLSGDLQARALLRAGLVAAIFTWFREANARWLPYPKIPQDLVPGGVLFKGAPLAKWSMVFDTSPLLLAAGAIMGFRPAWSLMAGALVNYLWLAPHGLALGEIPKTLGQRAILGYTVWFGTSLMLTSGLLSFAFSWRQIARAFSGLRTMFGGKVDPEKDPLAAVEVPMSWFVIGTLVVAPVVILCGSLFWGMKWWLTALCIFASFFLAIVACRATGETDTTPGSALAKITQIGAGALAPGSVTTNLMAANVSAGVALHSADLLTDLKSGYLLGAKPRQQFYAQFFGVVAGSAFVVPVMRLLIPDHTVIGTPKAPIPGALSWAAVAKALAKGLSHLTPSVRMLLLVGGVLGVVLVMLERWFPKKKAYIPSPIGLGLAFTMSFSNSLSFFLGACVALAFERKNKTLADQYVVPISSGILAGESLMGITIKALAIVKILQM